MPDPGEPAAAQRHTVCVWPPAAWRLPRPAFDEQLSPAALPPNPRGLMFYEPDKRNHGLPHDPFKALIVPRPIGWISSLDGEGRPNLAPYSFFNGVSSDPPCVMFGPSTRPRGNESERALKDSHRNAEHSGEFVVNLATFAQRAAMNASSAGLPAGENEFVAGG